MTTVIFSHGQESGPWGTKIRAMAAEVRELGCDADSVDYRGISDPSERVRHSVYSVFDTDPLGRRATRLYDRAVISHRWKLRWYTDTGRRIAKRKELYDLHSDPGENRPLDVTDPAYAEVVSELRRVLYRYELP